jgi:hypothetical protein
MFASPGSRHRAGLASGLTLQRGNGAIARSVNDKLREILSVKDFGAVGDGIADDTTAVAAALTALGSADGVIFFPSGRYLLSSGVLAKTLTGTQSIKLCGAGIDVTVLYFPSNGNGLSFTYTANQFAWRDGNSLTIEDLAFVTNVQNTGGAIVINGASAIGDPNRPTIIQRCGWRGTANNNSYWTNGVLATDLQNLVVNDCYYFGYTVGLLGTAVAYMGTAAGANPTVLNVHNLNMQFGAVGIHCTGYIEGLNVTQSNFTQVDFGILWDTTVAKPQCSILGCQINAKTIGIGITDGEACQIIGNLMFVTDTDISGTAIVGGNLKYSTIIGNTLVGLDAVTLPNGIILQSGSTDNVIDGNVFKGFSTNIWLQSGANNNIVSMNRSVDGTPVLDQGTNNYIVKHTTGQMTFSGGLTSGSSAGGVGYSTGSGGTVTQITSKATAVTLNAVTGAITMNNAALAAGTIVSFTLTNSAIAATDAIVATHESGGTTGAYTINARATGAGTAAIDVRNNTAGSLSEAIVIRFAVVRSVNA